MGPDFESVVKGHANPFDPITSFPESPLLLQVGKPAFDPQVQIIRNNRSQPSQTSDNTTKLQ